MLVKGKKKNKMRRKILIVIALKNGMNMSGRMTDLTAVGSFFALRSFIRVTTI
jgi:hypothetical protein